MPNSTILPQGLPDEGDDAPKKFKNIDTEPFEFTWGRKPFGGSLPERMRSYEEEEVTRDPSGEVISKRMVIKYEVLKGIEPEETVMMPKYLVNYAAMHLARKMYKRKMFAGKSEAERSIGIVRTVNPEEEYKLQIQMVAENFEKLPETPKFPKAPELKPDPPADVVSSTSITTTQPPSEITTTQPPSPDTPPSSTIPPGEKKEGEEKKPEDASKKQKCEICGKVCKDNRGLLAHKRMKHA